MPPEKPMIDARLTIEPPPRFFMYGIAVRAQMKLAFGSRSSPWSHSSPVSPVALLRTARPALFTRISMPPYCFSTSPRACTTAFSSVTSQPVAMSRIATLAPACSKSRAVAAPMPLAPPVTTATFPSTLNTSMETGSVYSAGVHDLLIRNALLLDGLGSPPARGDLAVSDGKITGIGAVDAAAKETIDAGGLALMPGIIDNHTHSDAQITWDPWVSPSPALGVATAVIGNCGFTIAPCRPADRERVMRNLTQVEGMSLDALRAGIRWDFQTVPQYLDMLESRGAAGDVP